MKNKLNIEEQILKEKLEGVSFDYQVAHWEEIAETIANKPAAYPYSSLVKAVAGIAILAGSVFFIQHYYDQESTTKPIANIEQVKKAEKQEAIQPDTKPTAEVEQNSAQKEEEKAAVLVEKTTTKVEPPAEKEHKNQIENITEPILENTTKKEDIVEEKYVEPQEDIIPIEEESTPVEKVVEDEDNEFENALNKINIDFKGGLCHHAELTFFVDNPLKDDQIEYRWFVNGNRQASRSSEVKYFTSKESAVIVQLNVIQNGSVVHTLDENYPLEFAALPNFRYRDEQDPFYDLHANFKVENQLDGEYYWYIEELAHEMKGEEVSYTFQNKGMYDLNLTHKADNGCITEFTKPIYIQEDFDPKAPELFTPNGDGANDEFIIKSFELDNTQFQMSIYHPNGVKVFHTTSTNEAWNGRMNNTGELQAVATYTWKVRIQNDKGIEKYFLGRVKMTPLKE